tara:strand:+ start:239 stop:418 length:180 start_codon:yes stop_codon:yes gene_type:complete
MSQFKAPTKKVSFTIEDTEMLIRLLHASQITGAEAKPLALVLDKVVKIHQELLTKMVEI